MITHHCFHAQTHLRNSSSSCHPQTPWSAQAQCSCIRPPTAIRLSTSRQPCASLAIYSCFGARTSREVLHAMRMRSRCTFVDDSAVQLDSYGSADDFAEEAGGVTRIVCAVRGGRWCAHLGFVWVGEEAGWWIGLDLLLAQCAALK